MNIPHARALEFMSASHAGPTHSVLSANLPRLLPTRSYKPEHVRIRVISRARSDSTDGFTPTVEPAAAGHPSAGGLQSHPPSYTPADR